ncbi:MAG TPA: phosphatidate cytidylyltransferase [Candidatus Aminicenantes bacterium]|nr:phosphatidate cytidylyltransferase [Candidatus Aminicenantes bacterium]
MNLVRRTLTAAVLLGVLFLIIQYAPLWVFFLLSQAVIVAALLELYALAGRNGLHPRKALGVLLALLVGLPFAFEAIPLEAALFAALLAAGVAFLVSVDSADKLDGFPAAFAFTVFGPLYLAFTLDFLYRVRLEFGPFPLYFLFAVVFLGDTGAFFIGKPFGRHKMTPTASPNKSWEGSAGGFLFALGGAALARWVLGLDVSLAAALLTAAAVHSAAQISDPLESLFKRAAGAKDSSNALPGHGGFLDRIDSLILAGPLFYFVVAYLWR